MNFGLLSRSCLPGPQSYTPTLTHTFILLSIQGWMMICASVCLVMDGGLFPGVDCCESRLCWLVISDFVCLFVRLSFWHKIESSGKGECQLRNYLYQIGLWDIFFVNDYCGKAQSFVGGATTEQAVLAYIKWKVDEQVGRGVEGWGAANSFIPGLCFSSCL